MKKLLLVFAVFLLHKITIAQTSVSKTNATTIQTASSVIVRKDPRIDLLIKKKAAVNKFAKKSVAHTARGYRLLILNTNNRDEAIAAKTKVYSFFPEHKAYLSYQAPFFKLKAGNFKTRDEAERTRKMMNGMFPKGVFIINDTIEVKAEKEMEEE